MIVFPPPALKRIVDLAEADYPHETCGLVVGRRAGETLRVTRIEPSRNLAPDPEHRFKIDSMLRLRLQRELRGSGGEVIGLYHSHPDGAAVPSATDLAQAEESGLVWIIVAVAEGQAIQVGAHRLAAAGDRFEEVALRTAPSRPAAEGGA